MPRQQRGRKSPPHPFAVQANGAPISEYRFRPAAATISFTLAYEEEQARIYAGMSTAEYDGLPGTPMWVDPESGGRCKSDVLILYRMQQYIPAVANDAHAQQLERDSKRRGH